MSYFFRCVLLFLQDIIGEDEINLDWFFIASLTNDIVNVSTVILSLFHCFIYYYLLFFTTN